MKTFRLMTCALLPLMALLWLPSSSGAQGPVKLKSTISSPLGCGCSPQDETDLESRIRQVEAAIKEYETLIKEWETKEKSGKDSLLLTPASRGSVQGSVGFRMSAARNSSARSFGAETDASCATSIDPDATPCLRGALQDHESVHKKACDSHMSMNPLADWREKQRVVDYMKEEQAGYQKELERLKDEVSKLQAFCSLDKSTRYELLEAAAQKQRAEEAYERVDGLRKVLR